MGMTSLRKRQKEALSELYNYNKKLIESLPKIAGELNGNRKEDTLSYLNAFLDGLNWVIEVTNGCMDYINEDKIRINQTQVKNTMAELNESVLTGDFEAVAQILQNGVESYLIDMQKISEELM